MRAIPSTTVTVARRRAIVIVQVKLRRRRTHRKAQVIRTHDKTTPRRGNYALVLLHYTENDESLRAQSHSSTIRHSLRAQIRPTRRTGSFFLDHTRTQLYPTSPSPRGMPGLGCGGARKGPNWGHEPQESYGTRFVCSGNRALVTTCTINRRGF